MSKRRPKISFSDAMDYLGDDMPDGAFFAAAHEMAGVDYGDGLDPLAKKKRLMCDRCYRCFATEAARQQHARDKHGKQKGATL